MRKRPRISTYGPRPSRVEAVIREVCERFCVTRDEILEGSQRKGVPAARAEICKGLGRMGFTLERIGLFLNVHHSTVHTALYGKASRSRESWQIPCPDFSGEWAI